MTSDTLPRLLLVEDDLTMSRALSLALRRDGYVVEQAPDGDQALTRLASAPFEAVLSDIAMPKTSGLELVRRLRDQGDATPVILMTGGPTLEGAIEAVERGVVSYLRKPIDLDELSAAVKRAVQSGEGLRQARRQAAERERLADDFDHALEGLFMVFQPIVRANGTAFAHEALARSRHAPLAHPGKLFAAAETLGRLAELSARIHALVAEALEAGQLAGNVFVNVEAADLDQPGLLDEDGPLVPWATRVVLELTERAALPAVRLRQSLAPLKEMGFRIAIDDLGAGSAGLRALTDTRPDVVKLDRDLVHGIDGDPVRQSLVLALVAHCRMQNALVVAEGVERDEEAAVVRDLRCDLLQGFLLGRPAPLAGVGPS